MESQNIVISLLDDPENLLYALPSILAIRSNYLGAAITLIINKQSAELIDFYPPNIIIKVLDDLDAPLEAEILNPEIHFPLGYSDESQKLAARIHAKEVQLSPTWDRYTRMVKINNAYNPFHQVDLFRQRTKQLYQEENFELTVPTDLRSSIDEHINGSPHIKVLIAVTDQTAEELIPLVDSILQRELNLRIYLIGTIKDRRLSSELHSRFQQSSLIIDLCGRLSLRQSAAIVHTSDMLISAPGLYTTLAAGFGTFCICIDSSHGNLSHRYPYGHGHLILQRDAAAISASTFAAAVADIVNFTIVGCQGSIPNQEAWQSYFDELIESLLGNMRIFITQRVQFFLEEGTSRTDLHLHPLLFTGAEFSDCMRAFYRLLWEKSLNGLTLTTHSLDILHETAILKLRGLLNPLEQLFELANFGQKYIGFIKNHLRTQNIEKAKKDADHLQEVDDLIQIVADSHPALVPICQYFTYTQTDCRSTEIQETAKEISAAYHTLQQHTLILLDLQKSLYQTTYEYEVSTNG